MRERRVVRLIGAEPKRNKEIKGGKRGRGVKERRKKVIETSGNMVGEKKAIKVRKD